MIATVIGSGGCVSLPRPACFCPVCTQAREKGQPYARYGCSLYLPEHALLVDTPEDIVPALNAAAVPAVDTILFSHWDPDHTRGMRVFEQLRIDWLRVSLGGRCENPLRVVMLPHVREDINRFYPGALDYYEKVHNLISVQTVETLVLEDLTVRLIPTVQRTTVFVFEQAGRRLIYAPCDVKPFPQSKHLHAADALVIGNTFPSDVVKGGVVIGPDNPLRRELFSLDEVIALAQGLRTPRVIITHIEEDWGRSYDDYLKMEKGLNGVRFAHDGMQIEL